MPAVPLSLRALNRALLERQHLLNLAALEPLQMVQHLLGLQAQVPNPPYIGLWTRLQHFEREQLTHLMENRQVLRLAAMRSTLHLLTAADALELQALVQPVLTRQLQGNHGRLLQGLNPQEVADVGKDLLTDTPMTGHDLGLALQRRWPDHDPRVLSQTVRNHATLVHLPPAGTWNHHKHPLLSPIEAVLGVSLNPSPDLEALVLRYLQAFGPATPQDMAAWCGLTGLVGVFKKLQSRLVALQDEQGRTLYDVPDASLPDPDLPVPVRFLPEFDNILLSHADRSRILPPHFKARVFTSNGIVRSTVLIDGFVAGLWKLEQHRDTATLHIGLFGDIDAFTHKGLQEEGERLLANIAPSASRHGVEIQQV